MLTLFAVTRTLYRAGAVLEMREMRASNTSLVGVPLLFFAGSCSFSGRFCSFPLCLRPPLANVPSPTPKGFDHLGRDRCGHGYPYEDKGFVDCVCKGELRPYACRAQNVSDILGSFPITTGRWAWEKVGDHLLALSPLFAASASLTP